MSNLQKFDNSAAEQLLSLAEELGIDISDNANNYSNLNTGSLYTNYIQPEKVRTVIDMHKGDTIRWTVPGETKEFEEKLYYKTSDGQLVEWSDIKEVSGIVVDYSQRDQLAYFDGEKVQTLCSVIGYNYPSSPVKDLPKVPYGNKYQWDKKIENGSEKNFINHEKVNPIVEKLGLIGLRGGKPTPCSECIKCGMSTEERADENGNFKTYECEARGKLHIAVYNVTKITLRKVKGGDPIEQKETKSVFDLYTMNDDGEGTPLDGPFLLQFNMSKSAIQGRWNKDELISIVGFEGYVRNLERTYSGSNARKNPLFNTTGIRLKKNPKAPTYQTNFESFGMPDASTVREAVTLWKNCTPVRSLVSLQVEVLPPPPVSKPIRSASPLESDSLSSDSVDVEVIDTDSLPF